LFWGLTFAAPEDVSIDISQPTMEPTSSKCNFTIKIKFEKMEKIMNNQALEPVVGEGINCGEAQALFVSSYPFVFDCEMENNTEGTVNVEVKDGLV